jgi:hypothetical protein
MTSTFSYFYYLLDVICGRGSQANKHIGNVRFRERVKKFREIYRTSCKSDKHLVALQIVLELKAMSPTGKFLTKPPPAVHHTSGVVVDPDYWMEVHEVQAVRKVSQRLREEKVTTCGVNSRRRPQGRVPFTTKIKNNVETTSQQEESTVSHHESPRSQNDESDTPNVVPAIQSFASRRFEPDHGEAAPGDNHVVLEIYGVPTAATLLELLEADS